MRLEEPGACETLVGGVVVTDKEVGDGKFCYSRRLPYLDVNI